MRIKNQSKRRTSSKGAENKFSAYGEQVQKELRTSSKLAEMRIKENSLAQEKKFPWAREKIPLGKRIATLLLHSLKWYRRLVSFFALSLRNHSYKKVNAGAMKYLRLPLAKQQQNLIYYISN